MEILWLVAVGVFSYSLSTILFAKVVSGMTEDEWGFTDSWGAASTLEKTKSALKFCLVIVGDTLKAFFPVYVFTNLAPSVGYDRWWALLISSVCVVMGHNFPIDMKRFHGGRGLACAFGALLAVSWFAGLAGLVSLGLWILVTNAIMKKRFQWNFKKLFRENIPGRLVGIILYLPVLYYFVGPKPFLALLPMMVFVIIHHWQRLKDYSKAG